VRPAATDKPCVVCGRTITWRKKWARDWDHVRYCSTACRRTGIRPIDRALERAVLHLLDTRPAGVTICPSDAARVVTAALAHPAGPGEDAWRALMEPARAAARRLMGQGEVDITQGGRIVADPSRVKGPIRIRRRRSRTLPGK